jgi:hypothetical protein
MAFEIPVKICRANKPNNNLAKRPNSGVAWVDTRRAFTQALKILAISTMQTSDASSEQSAEQRGK